MICKYRGCSSLASVTIEDGVQTLSLSMPFAGCPIQSLYLGRNYDYSYLSPFRDNKSLTSVTFGNSVTSIGGSAFSGCSGLKEIYARSTTPPTIYASTFTNYTPTLYVPTGCVSAYKNATYWKKFYDIREGIPTGIVALPDNSLFDEAHPNARRDVIYTVEGRRVQQDWEQLPQGIYIINGKKVFIK